MKHQEEFDDTLSEKNQPPLHLLGLNTFSEKVLFEAAAVEETTCKDT